MIRKMEEPGLQRFTTKNKSWKEGRISRSWKLAIIRPAPKADKDSYTPTSFMSCLSKTMERIIQKRLLFKTPTE